MFLRISSLFAKFKISVLSSSHIFNICLPFCISSSFICFWYHCLIFDRALEVFTIFNQSRLGPLLLSLVVKTSIVSPVLILLLRFDSLPLTFAPIIFSPTSVWTANAKSTAVEPDGRVTTSPFGVKQNISSSYKSSFICWRNSFGSGYSVEILFNSLVHSDRSLEGFSLYFQCAATPNSAR